MRSIPLALTWEMLYRGRWTLTAAGLGATAFPLIIFAALRAEGGLDPSDPSTLIMHVVITQLNMFVFGIAVLAAQGNPSRLFAFPAPNSTIAVWHMLPAMAIMAIESLASTAFLNVVFQLDWPLWGPALFVAVLLAAVQAVLWLMEKSGWLPLAVALAALVLGVWFKARYGAPFSMPERYWRTITPGEVATLLAIAVAAYFTALAGVTRNRRGSAPFSVGIIAWLERAWNRPSEAVHPFSGPEKAQFWFEWRQKGWAMPVVVAFGMLFGLSLWSIFDRDPVELYAGFVAGGGLLCVAALVGALVVGNTGSSDSATEMGPFLGARPMTTSEMARVILKTAAGSVFLAWLIWAIGFLVVYGILASIDRLPPSSSIHWSWWYFPASLLGTWIVLTTGASIGLIGRQYLLVKVLTVLLGGYIGLILFAGSALSQETQELFGRAVAVAVSVAFLLGTAWAFSAAHRRLLIGWPTIYVAGSIWVVLTAILALAWTRSLPMPISAMLLLVGLAALAVAPLATTPLALAWNRNR
jgi:hypothetical protein